MTADIPNPLYDIAIVGGGVNGCGIARDAAGRGLSVLLLERGDLAQGTSSASTKLIHGGLRYLEYREFGLVREALSERERLWNIAPHIIHPMRFVLPWTRGLRPRWLLRAGLFLYDHLGGRKALPATEAIDLRTHRAGVCLKPVCQTGWIYSDAWVDDARLVVLNARDAADRGADVRPRCAMLSAKRGRDEWALETSKGVFRARILVNAAGPAALDLLHRAGIASDRRIRLVRGSHIVVPRLFDHDLAYFFQLPDGRIFFAIPYEADFTLIGTTDRDHEGGLGNVGPSDEEIAYLCAGANHYFRRAITPSDVVWSYAGVRPLIEDGSGRPEAATRGYELQLDQHGAPLLSVFGGKITTYRHLAEAVMKRLAPILPSGVGGEWTADTPLPGGDFAKDGLDRLIADLRRDYPFLAARTADRIGRAYGTAARGWLRTAGSWSDLGLVYGQGLSEAEVRYLIDREWARTAEDILWRRTKLGLRMTDDLVARLAQRMEAVL